MKCHPPRRSLPGFTSGNYGPRAFHSGRRTGLVGGYDGEHLVHLAGLHGDDPREVRDALPSALRDCGVQMPESGVAAAEIVFTQLARMYLEGEVEAIRVLRTVGAVLAWSGYLDNIIGMPLGYLLFIEDE